MKVKNLILGGSIVLAAAAGCAKTDETSSNEQSKIYIDAWVEKNYPDATVEGNGIYVLEDTPGTGETYNGEDYIVLSYTIRSMDGTISSTVDEDTAKQVGTYDETYTYDMRIWYVAGENITVGLEDMLTGMSIGETKKALIPSWLMVTERRDNADEYFKHTSSSSTVVYEITLLDFTDDIYAWQIDKIEDYIGKTYGSLDSLSYGYYYKQLSAPTDSLPTDTTIYINYIGRLLNGKVFDTTIKDTAKKYGLYSADDTYEPVEITLAEDESDITMTIDDDETSIITGLQKMLAGMGAYEKGESIFISGYGYGASGSGNTIIGYAALRFEVEVTDEPEDDD